MFVSFSLLLPELTDFDSVYSLHMTSTALRPVAGETGSPFTGDAHPAVMVDSHMTFDGDDADSEDLVCVCLRVCVKERSNDGPDMNGK